MKHMKRMTALLLVLCLALAACAAMAEGTVYHNTTLHYNCDEIADVILQVKEGGRAKQPDTPEREGYIFGGWYTNEASTEKFIFSTKLSADTDLYAQWLTCTTFEAEFLMMDEMSGPGYSGAAYDYSMIVKDRWDAGASNGKFVSYLYASYDNSAYNTTLEFHIDATAAAGGATLILRLSAEYADIVINGDTYEVLVNGVKYGYDDITFTGAADATNNSTVLPFADFTISSSVNLQEGENVIILRTNNNTKQGSGGTMNSTAPMVDCIKIAAEGTVLTWNEDWVGDEYEE